MAENPNVSEGLASLKIDRNRRQSKSGGWAKWWILLGIALFLAFGIWRLFLGGGSALAVETYRVRVETAGGSESAVVLNAAGYIVPHHKIEVASKVVGRVKWIGVEKGDKVEAGQVLVRLEDDEYRARFIEADGQAEQLAARLQELETGSRPEEIALADANLREAKANLENAKIELDRSRELFDEGVFSKQAYDDAKARYDAQAARVASLDRAFELRRIGPREESIAAARGQVRQASGTVAYAKTLLDSTIIKAPVTGTILERNVEVGEFVTTGFVGDRGAKGYVVSLADLNDIQVELDISQEDFSKLAMGQKAVVTTDAFRDRDYKGEIVEMSPEADRQKATVQVKVQILEPDSFLRPEMNANVAFLAPDAPSTPSTPTQTAAITIPPSALRDGNKVFLLVNGRAVERGVQVRARTSNGAEIESGLNGGEDLILSPPEGLRDGDPVQAKTS